MTPPSLDFTRSGHRLPLIRQTEAAECSLACRPRRLEIEDLPQLKLPAILRWGLNHFVVLKATKRQSLSIHDTPTEAENFQTPTQSSEGIEPPHPQGPGRSPAFLFKASVEAPQTHTNPNL